jgi:hypothetical protein
MHPKPVHLFFRCPFFGVQLLGPKNAPENLYTFFWVSVFMAYKLLQPKTVHETCTPFFQVSVFVRTNYG